MPVPIPTPIPPRSKPKSFLAIRLSETRHDIASIKVIRTSDDDLVTAIVLYIVSFLVRMFFFLFNVEYLGSALDEYDAKMLNVFIGTLELINMVVKIIQVKVVYTPMTKTY